MNVVRRFRPSLIAGAALGAALASTPSHAYVYAESFLSIKNLVIATSPLATPGSFTFRLDQAADIDAVQSSSTATCTQATCSNVSPVLSAAVVNAPGSTVNRANDNFAKLGVVAGQTYSNADSQILSAQLTQGVPTSTNQIAESLLNTNGSAGANTSVQSNTGLTWTFTLPTTGSLTLTFDANPDLAAIINDPLSGVYSAQADISTIFTLTRSSASGGGSFGFNPDGAVNACSGSGIGTATCTEDFDPFTLNTSVGVSSNPDQDIYSDDGNTFGTFKVSIAGLSAGTYTVLLQGKTSTLITREAVPEPASLGLVGLSLALLGFVSRRRFAKSAQM